MRPNRLRELVNAGTPSIGTHVMSSWPAVVELIGHAGGIDYVEFLAEDAPFSLQELENFGRAVDLFDGLSAMIKIPSEPRTFVAARAIGAGIQNVLFADVRTAEDARECVAALRPETPQGGGLFGCKDQRFTRAYILESGSQEYVQALEDVVIAIMIEKDEAVKNLEEILSVKGVDMVVFGGGDYSMSTGKLGQAGSPEIREIRDHVYKTALKMGVQPRVELTTPDQAKHFLDMGCRHFAIGHDLAILYFWWRDKAQELRGRDGWQVIGKPLCTHQVRG